MTAALPWTSVVVATGYRGNPRFSTTRATAHGGPSAANSVVPTMATHGSPRKFHGNFRGRPTTATPTAVRGHSRPLPR